MAATVVARDQFQIRCHWRPLILSTATALLLSLFWFTSRYPQLIDKSHHMGTAVFSMAFSKSLIAVTASTPVWMKIFAAAVNWLDSMKIGMTFGVLLGALLHTVLRYYLLKIGNNLYLNSIKGALVGVPMGVCVNCAVPTACGVTRGHGRVEVALGFMFSSPNFNPVVIMMTLAAFPFSMFLTKYLILIGVITIVVPSLIRWLERDKPLAAFGADDGGGCAITLNPSDECTESFFSVLGELSIYYVRHVWMLLKPTITLMLLAAFASAALLVLVPWDSLLSHSGAGTLGFVSVLATLMPVPIALDVMFASQLQQRGINPAFVMLFLTTLGTFSIIPATYLWREVSRRLSVSLVILFVVTGWIVGMIF